VAIGVIFHLFGKLKSKDLTAFQIAVFCLAPARTGCGFIPHRLMCWKLVPQYGNVNRWGLSAVAVVGGTAIGRDQYSSHTTQVSSHESEFL
jgi:hypothetical protein